MTMWDQVAPWLPSIIAGGLTGVVSSFILLATKWGEGLMKLQSDKSLEVFKGEQNRSLESVKADLTRSLEAYKSEQSRGIEAYKAEQTRALEVYKAGQNQGLEDLKERLNHMADRGKRSNENEFAALKSVWSAFIDAYAFTYRAIVSFIQHPDLSTMPQDDLESFLKGQGFSQSQVKLVMGSRDRNSEFVRLITWTAINDAAEKIRSAHEEIRHQRIFFPDDIRNEFLGALDLIGSAQAQRSVQYSHEGQLGSSWGESIRAFLNNGDAAVDKVASAVNKRLMRTDAQL